MQQVSNPYLLVVRKQWLRVNCVQNRNLTSAENLKLETARKPTLNSSILVTYLPSQPRRMGYPLGSFPTQVGLHGGWRSAGPVKNIQHIWLLQTKNPKQNLLESDSENEAAVFPRFIVIESLEEVCLAKFSPFLIEKVISTRASPKTVKKTRNGNLLVEVDSRRQAENILKIKMFHTTKSRVCPHKKLNISKGVIRRIELALATEDKIASALGKQGVTNIERISIRKGEQQIQTNTYILTFNKPQTPNRLLSWESLAVRPSSPWGASNVKNLDTTEKPVEDNRHVPNVVKRTQTMQWKISWKKFDVQTVNKII